MILTLIPASSPEMPEPDAAASTTAGAWRARGRSRAGPAGAHQVWMAGPEAIETRSIDSEADKVSMAVCAGLLIGRKADTHRQSVLVRYQVYDSRDAAPGSQG